MVEQRLFSILCSSYYKKEIQIYEVGQRLNIRAREITIGRSRQKEYRRKGKNLDDKKEAGEEIVTNGGQTQRQRRKDRDRNSKLIKDRGIETVTLS